MLILALLTASCRTTVQHGLEEDQANRIVALFEASGLEAHKVKEEGRGGKYAVQVSRGQESQAIGLLRRNELPHRTPPGFGEVYGKTSLVPTAAEQQARYVHALSGEIARTLEAVPGVREARVLVVLPRRDPLDMRRVAHAPRASVLLRVESGKPPIAVGAVRRLVAGSVDGLAPDKVAVVIQPNRPLSKAAGLPALAQVGPVAVSRDSRALLLGILVSGLVVILLLAAALVFLLIRLGRMRRQVAEGEAPDAEPGALPGD